MTRDDVRATVGRTWGLPRELVARLPAGSFEEAMDAAMRLSAAVASAQARVAVPVPDFDAGACTSAPRVETDMDVLLRSAHDRLALRRRTQPLRITTTKEGIR